MCGTAGLFVGCPVVSFCPRRRVLADAAAAVSETPGLAYRSPFRTWYERAAVRAAPRRILEGSDGHVFPPELVPVAAHPVVRSMPPEAFRQVLVGHLYRYLDFTAKLEHLVVNQVATGIAHGTIKIPLPTEMRLDAYKIYCDEGYHALFSADLLEQLQVSTGVAARLDDTPFFLRRLAEILDAADPVDRSLIEILFVVVSETLISATLAGAAGRTDFDPAVRDAIRDHAMDEGRHHAYFAAFLRHLWAALDPRQRRLAGRVVPRLIRAFLDPDSPTITAELRAAGLSAEAADLVVADVFPEPTLRAYARETASQTISYFAQLDAFSDAASAELLERDGLLASSW